MMTRNRTTAVLPPKLVLFDLDDTLCDHDGSLRIRLHASFVAAFGGDPPDNIEEIVELDLPEEEVTNLRKAAEAVREKQADVDSLV
jgi:FMN phosphatase YigB (HAD superfamily)